MTQPWTTMPFILFSEFAITNEALAILMIYVFFSLIDDGLSTTCLRVCLHLVSTQVLCTIQQAIWPEQIYNQAQVNSWYLNILLLISNGFNLAIICHRSNVGGMFGFQRNRCVARYEDNQDAPGHKAFSEDSPIPGIIRHSSYPRLHCSILASNPIRRRLVAGSILHQHSLLFVSPQILRSPLYISPTSPPNVSQPSLLKEDQDSEDSDSKTSTDIEVLDTNLFHFPACPIGPQQYDADRDTSDSEGEQEGDTTNEDDEIISEMALPENQHLTLSRETSSSTILTFGDSDDEEKNNIPTSAMLDHIVFGNTIPISGNEEENNMTASAMLNHAVFGNVIPISDDGNNLILAIGARAHLVDDAEDADAPAPANRQWEDDSISSICSSRASLVPSNVDDSD